MTGSLRSFATIVLAVASFPTCIAAADRPPTPLLGAARPASAAELPAHAAAGSSGLLDARALDAQAITLTLPDGRSFTVHLQRQARDAQRGVHTWIGSVEDGAGGSLVITRARGVVSGFAQAGGEVLEILPLRDGRHVVFVVDEAQVPGLDGVEHASEAGDTATLADAGATTTLSTAGNPVTHDLLVFYTPASAGAYGQAALAGMIESAVQAANQAYANSQAGIVLQMVGLQQSPVVESGSGMSATLGAFRSNGQVRALRDQLAADMVMLVSQDTDWCGYASLAISSTTINGTTTSNTDAYAVSAARCLSNNTLAHEVGHLQGLDHDRANATGNSGFYEYSYGYRRCVTGGFLDIMSYPCATSLPRILQFSNPALYYNGYATGVSWETDPANSAEAARSLDRSAAQVAAYRVAGGGAATPPAAPSGLRATQVSHAAVALAWTDNAGNESGFTLERSRDGVVYQPIATLGANAVGFTDGAVSASTAYYYRLNAFNGAGASAWTAPIGVRTADPPVAAPPPPTGVTAANRGDGSALVAWTTGTTSATAFEVRRETWNSRKLTWGAGTLVASVPSGTLSVVDASGNGTFRYFVRAINAGGASANAGPAAVTVTGAARRGKSR